MHYSICIKAFSTVLANHPKEASVTRVDIIYHLIVHRDDPTGVILTYYRVVFAAHYFEVVVLLSRGRVHDLLVNSEPTCSLPSRLDTCAPYHRKETRQLIIHPPLQLSQ